MKRISIFNYCKPACNTAAVLLISGLLAPIVQAEGNDATRQTTGGVPYVSGGIGSDAIDRLDAMAGQFNVKLVFALQSGEYLSDVKVTIVDAAGKPLLDTVSDGPWLMTKLRPGRYQIVASYGGKTEKHSVTVGAAKLSTVDFRWRAD